MPVQEGKVQIHRLERAAAADVQRRSGCAFLIRRSGSVSADWKRTGGVPGERTPGKSARPLL